ncbi:MAG: tetratricopeptide repeat protein [Acidobacteriia bacterium]|nr:tetratricopeptide repeat protein [Terriglobia bacterium]
MGRFLRLAVERTLDGRSGELKEYLFGIEVFDRKASFDPRVDPIVRVEARRLRSKLQTYYDGDGQNDSIVFEFARGTYVPTIRARAEPKDEPAPRPAQTVATVAVLPFVNLSGSVDHDYLSDGLTEELIHALTKVSGMRVVAWNSAARLRSTDYDIPEIGRQLQVAHALTGSVRIAGSSMRVRVQLIDTTSGVYLWSETFDRQLGDVFTVQEEIARNIVRTLRVQLAAGVEDALARPPHNVSSYDYYLKGRYYWHQRTPDGLTRSTEFFEAAIQADADSALGYAGLADAHVLIVEYGLAHPEEGIPKARAAAARAIELDPNLAEAYPALALIRSQYEWQWEAAEMLYRKAIALNPGYSTPRHWLGTDHLANLGRMEEAAAEIEIALELDPLSSIIHEGRGYLHMLNREYEQAIYCYQKILEFDPNFYKAYSATGRALALMGRYKEALAMLEKARSLAGEVLSMLAAMGQVFALSGDTDSARGVLARLTARSREIYVPSTCFAMVHMGLGEREQALAWLEKGCEQRELTVASLKVHPVYDPLRPEPRFQALLRKLRLA